MANEEGRKEGGSICELKIKPNGDKFEIIKFYGHILAFQHGNKKFINYRNIKL